MIKQAEIMVIGGGPAGLCAAISASSMGAKVLLAERDEIPGGQLVKQTHKFFGSEKQYAGERGIHIGQLLTDSVKADPNIEIWTDSTVLGIYEDGVVTVLHGQKHVKVKPERIIIATGAAEKFLAFPGNDLPGIYGAGAVQTLMNVSGIKPAERVLMIGAGNIGLIVAYQLKQAGVEVAAVIEGSSEVGGYLVHASKIRRAGIPILTNHTIVEAFGEDKVDGAVIAQVDKNWQIINGTEKTVPCDTICLAVGLSPLAELAWQAGCQMTYIRELSGHVPLLDENLETTRKGIYCAGDVCAIEEASSAMVEGKLAGIAAAASLGHGKDKKEQLLREAKTELDQLRCGPLSAHIRTGMEKVAAKRGTSIEPQMENKSDVKNDEIKSTLKNDGVPTETDIACVSPSAKRFGKGCVAVVECFQQIPCNPCVKACKRGAITIQGDINGLPVVDMELCNGCGVCISLCPGLAIFIVDNAYSDTHALVKLPYEYVPVPQAGDLVTGLSRGGENLGSFMVERVTSGGKKNKTYTVSLVVPKELAMQVRDIRIEV
ncbi:MAG: FAD-dependent oxidoreductase [Oscillospiraceae bacterium]|nr:FAD-dependent oxidoreductase [Oscillospiraceae bacterium]